MFHSFFPLFCDLRLQLLTRVLRTCITAMPVLPVMALLELLSVPAYLGTQEMAWTVAVSTATNSSFHVVIVYCAASSRRSFFVC